MNTTRPVPIALVACLAAVVSLIGSLAGMSAQPVVEDEPQDRQQLVNIGLAYHLVDAVFNARDPAAATTLVADDAVIRTPSGQVTGPGGLLRYVATIRHAYPDATFAITSLSVTNDSAHIEWILTATQSRVNTAGRLDIRPVALTGVFTVGIGDGAVTHLATISEDVLVAGPADSIVAESSLDGPALVGSGPERAMPP